MVISRRMHMLDCPGLVCPAPAVAVTACHMHMPSCHGLVSLAGHCNFPEVGLRVSMQAVQGVPVYEAVCGLRYASCCSPSQLNCSLCSQRGTLCGSVALAWYA